MGRVDQLPADQRAALQLLLRQGRSYAELSSLLSIPPEAVRERALAGLEALGGSAPDGLEAEGSEAVGDYLLAQGSDDERAATRALLESSAPARAWARSVRGELAPLARNGLPDVPPDPPGQGAPAAPPDAAVSPGADAPPAAAAPPAGASSSGADARRPRSSRLGGAIVLALIVAGVAVGLALLLRGDDEPKRAAGGDRAATTAGAEPTVEAQVNLRPPQGSRSKALGIVQLVRYGDERALSAVVEGLAPPRGVVYGLWLYSGPSKARWLGYFREVDAQGRAAAQAPLDVAPRDFDELLITRQRDRTPSKPGPVVLRGTIA